MSEASNKKISTHTLSAEALATLATRVTTAGIACRTDGILGSDVTTYAIGGTIPLLIEPRNPTEAVTALRLCAEAGIKPRMLGNGSNLLISSAGITGAVIRYREKELSIAEEQVTVSGGYPFMPLSRLVSERGLAGLEFAGGIPGSLGGACFMNAGAHGGELGERIVSISVATQQGIELIKGSELPWKYRHSGLLQRYGNEPFLVVCAQLQLAKSSPELTSAKRAHCLEERKARQPLFAASAGSVFRNPVGSSPGAFLLSAGALIEQAGLKGRAIGGAMVSELHGNWIINPRREASSEDVLALINLCKQTVVTQFSVELHEEVVYWE